MFITFEGVEGCGKTTLAARIADELRTAGLSVLHVRDPGDTPLGDEIRRVLLHGPGRVDPLSELLLFWAARRQLLVERIAPALAEGRVVISDRFFDSTAAYQGYGRRLPLETIAWLRATVCAGCEPDATVLLDVDPAVGLERAGRERAPDRMEQAGVEFLARVRAGFLAIARQEPKRVIIIPVVEGVETMLASVREAIAPRLRAAGVRVPTSWESLR